MYSCIVKLKVEPLVEILDEHLEPLMRQEFEKIQRNRTPSTAPVPDGDLLTPERVGVIRENLKVQALDALRRYCNDPQATVESDCVRVKVQAPYPVGEPYRPDKSITMVIPGLDDIAPAEQEPKEYHVDGAQEWSALTDGKWLEWIQGVIHLCDEEPERGKKFVEPAPNLPDAVRSRVLEAIEVGAKMGALSYLEYDRLGY
jgi:hypothetical protein